jgi:predicted CXXCH cytochrome family protein
LPIILLAAACTDETVVFKTRDLFSPVEPAAAGFIGYSDSTAKLVVCGNCHVSIQDQWDETAHAGAWATLQASGSAQAVCEGCHTVGQRGNVATTAGGYETVKDPRYHDVQCEACHGPGLTHVQDPDASQPLAPVNVDTDLTYGCGECHNGTHHPFVEEWSQSAHANVRASPAGNASCVQCHRGQGILAAWNVKSDYLEKAATEHVAITCAVCHDPHDGTFDSQLRFTVNTPSIEEHLCARCHNRRTNPDPTSTHGLEPHAPEAALLVGDAGWFVPGANIDQGTIRGTHGSERNPKLCATCHVNSFTVTDEITGDFVFQATGHLFTAVPCLNDQGIPQPGDCGFSTTSRSFAGCTESGCHGSPTAALSALTAATLRLQSLADQLESLLLEVDPNLDAAGGEIDPTQPTFTIAEGALFNLELTRHGATHTVAQFDYAAAATHNPFLMESLLIASIAEVQREYGVSSRAAASGQSTSLAHE